MSVLVTQLEINTSLSGVTYNNGSKPGVIHFAGTGARFNGSLWK